MSSLFVIFILSCSLFSSSLAQTPRKYVATIQGNGGTGPSIGTITFQCSGRDNFIHVTGTINGLTRSETGMNGFHIHELGDMSNGCQSAGPHFNPTGQDHGAPTDSARHVGDLGNIAIDQSGTATLDLWDRLLDMEGPNSILGRSVVIHAKEDDLGRGDNQDSRKTGNSGGRIACGVIGRAASN